MKKMFVITRPMVISLVVFIVASAFSFAQEMPQFNTPEEKAEWIKQNPQQYRELIELRNKVVVPTPSADTHYQTQNSATAIQPVASEKISSTENKEFPRYVDTGDKVKDDENYHLAKQAWIEANPEAYKKLNAPN